MKKLLVFITALCIGGGVLAAKLTDSHKNRPRGAKVGPFMFPSEDRWSFRAAERHLQDRANSLCRSGRARLIRYTLREYGEARFPGRCTEVDDVRVCEEDTVVPNYAVNGKFRCR